MSSKHPSKFRNTLALRLTLWYTGIFALSSLMAFVLLYLLATAIMRAQTDQELLGEVDKFATLLAVEGIEAVKGVAVLESQAGGVKKTFFRFLDNRGGVFSSSNMYYWKDIGVDTGAVRQLIDTSHPVFQTIDIAGRPYQVRILYGFIGPGLIVQLGRSMELYGHFLGAFWKIFAAAMSALILLAGLAGWFMARRAVAGVEEVTRTARAISRDSLERRVVVGKRGDEIDELAMTFNEMLDRIEKLVVGMKEMSDNIAHDLKSPLTRIRGLAEVTLATEKSTSEYESMAANVVEECDRLLEMINTMLMISEAEAGVTKRGREAMDLSRLAEDACQLFQPLADEKNIRLLCEGAGPLPFCGIVRQIQRMIANLIDNAVKYTNPGGTVTLSWRKEGGALRLAVADTGEGVPEKDMPHIFDRFYRGDQSRSREGAGLGLSLARAVARFHGGDISVENRPGGGSIFTVSFPKLSAQDAGCTPHPPAAGRAGGLNVRSKRA